MVERQPEKLKVVGSNPILDKMLFLFFYLNLIVCLEIFLITSIFFAILIPVIYYISVFFKSFSQHKFRFTNNLFLKTFTKTNVVTNFNYSYIINCYYTISKTIILFFLLKLSVILPHLNIFNIK